MTTRRALDFEYAIKKDVRNNPIVREIDEERQRQLWRTAGISAVLVLVVLFSAWQTLELVLHGYEVQRLERERASEEEVNRHLRLEIETLRSPKRIEEMAIKDLKLVAPARDQAIVIERVTPAAPPEKSIVALRGAQGESRAPPPGLGPLNQPLRRQRWQNNRPAAEGNATRAQLVVSQHGELPHAPTPNVAWRSTLSTRVLTAAALFVLWTVGIQARLVYLQVIDHADMQARADRQHMRTITAPAKRGEIVDRNGQMLAYSVDADSVFADPSEIEHPDKVAQLVCGALDDCSARERQEMAQGLRRDTQFAYLARKVSPDEAQRVKALELKGVGFIKESRRYYPKKELAAHVLGYVGLDNTGLAGLESTYDAQVRGREGKVLIQTDARRHALNSRVDRPATEGAALELSIDQNLQYIAERELRAGVEENRAAGGSAVIMDPSTGEILALANWPTFNPNMFGRADDRERRNRAIQDLYEPGSTFKVVTASAALEERVIRPDDWVDCAPGYIKIGSRKPIHDVHRYGTLSFTDVIVKSSNVGAIKVGLRLGPERLGPLRQPLRIRPDAEPRLPRRKPGHRLESGAGERQRARLDVHGLPGRRDAAADGGRRQLGGQRRLADGAARRPRRRQERPAAFRWRRRCCARRCRRRRSPSCERSWKASSSAARRNRRRFPATPSPARPGQRPRSSTATTRSRSTTPRSSASFPRGSRR